MLQNGEPRFHSIYFSYSWYNVVSKLHNLYNFSINYTVLPHGLPSKLNTKVVSLKRGCNEPFSLYAFNAHWETCKTQKLDKCGKEKLADFD